MKLVTRTVAVSAFLLVYVPSSQNSEEAYGSPIHGINAQWHRLPLVSTCLD